MAKGASVRATARALGASEATLRRALRRAGATATPVLDEVLASPSAGPEDG